MSGIEIDSFPESWLHEIEDDWEIPALVITPEQSLSTGLKDGDKVSGMTVIILDVKDVTKVVIHAPT